MKPPGHGIPTARQAGFLTYDLQQFTEDCLYRIAQAIIPVRLKAYPVFFHPNQDKARFSHRPSEKALRFMGVNITGSTPESLASNANFRAAWTCVRESDVVVLFGLQGVTALVAGLLGPIFGRTLISVNQTLPVSWEMKRRWWVRWLKKWLLGRCRFHVYQTPVTRDVLRSVYRVDEDSMYYAPFEAGASWFKGILKSFPVRREEARKELGLNGEVVFLFVGTLLWLKGVADIIEAASVLPGDVDFVCIFAGREEPRDREGGTIANYLAIAQRLGVERRVRFLGSLAPERLARIYQISDVVVLPTRRDMFPKVLVEGGLAGKPLITTSANGAAGTIVLDGENGFIVEPGDVGGLARAMEALLDEPLRKRMGMRSRELTETFCDGEAETLGFAGAIEKAISNLPGAPRYQL